MNSNDALTLDLRNVNFHSATTVETFRDGVGRLLMLVRDVVAVVDFADSAVLLQTLAADRQRLLAATDAQQVTAIVAESIAACREMLARTEALQLEQKQEIASLVSLIREAMAVVTGGSELFHTNIGTSLERFEKLVSINDVRQLKLQLVHEVRNLRQITIERQKEWAATTKQFAARVEQLEGQLTASKHEAAVDPLTQVSNRRAFERTCREWLSAKRHHFVLATIDVDHFKTINDTHGHPVGDQALIAVAEALKKCVRVGEDVIARVGGDEFALIAMSLPMAQLERRLVGVLAQLRDLHLETSHDTPPTVTLSCGVVECSAGDTLESLLERADQALYEAKRLGRSRVIAKRKATIRDLLRS